jgi:hypothetical protein
MGSVNFSFSKIVTPFLPLIFFIFPSHRSD